MTGALLRWLLVSCVALIGALLVLISVVWGPTRLPIALLLAAAWVALIALLVAGARRRSMRWRCICASASTSKKSMVGDSWGSALGIMLVQRYPELFHAFIGAGQMVAFAEDDLLCYQFALNWARQRGDSAKGQKLLAQGPPPYYGDDVAWKESTFLLDTYAYMNQNPAIYDGGNPRRDILSPEYGLYDKLSWLRGPIQTLGMVYPQLSPLDFRTQATHLDVRCIS